MSNEADRCTGNCCNEFVMTIGDSVEAIRTRLLTNVYDGHFIADMLIPIRPLVAGSKLPNGDVLKAEDVGTRCIGWVFTCKHFDREKRACTVYESRPNMCREYPYGKPCEHGDQCSWSQGRAGLYPPAHWKIKCASDGGSTRAKQTIHLRVLEQRLPALESCECRKRNELEVQSVGTSE